ncbi:hypothetical protein [Streptomyces murinus]|uniref:hypothetical protein n=1 Tax=Streptomyces murinus TaxID=33900 RepID=UPI0037FB9D45
MKTCRKFEKVRAEYEREIGFMLARSRRYGGKSAAKSSERQAVATKQRMARALSHHAGRCPECG